MLLPYLRRPVVVDVAVAVVLAAGVIAVAAVVDGTCRLGAVSAGCVVAAVVWVTVRRRRTRLAVLLAVCSVLSLVSTFAQPYPVPDEAAVWRIVEVAALLVLLGAVVRWSPVRLAVPAGCVAAAACTLWPVALLGPASWLERVGAATFWLLPVLAAVAVGGYPRWQAHRLRNAVLDARRRQQLDLAQDLHDFLAHDVSAIVTQAQAARFVAGNDPEHVLDALERIERAGLNALSLLDGTVRMLHEARGKPVPTTTPSGIEQLAAVVDGFTSTGGAPCQLHLDQQAAAVLSPEARTAAYRVVVEGLTNIRRHAPNTPQATVTVGWSTQGGVEVVVANEPSADGHQDLGPRSYGGNGLAGLRERVTTAGGVLSAGPDGHGWRLTATFPVVPAPATSGPA